VYADERGGIFVSYRRQESSGLAGRLYDRLAERFGEGQVFIDVDTIEPGVDFAEEISRAVAAGKVLLAVIGPNWLTVTDKRGRRRLDDPDDIVRLEIEAALARDVRVIPILVDGAVMPDRDDLPDSLTLLARRNGFPIRHESFRPDAGRLVTAIERVLAAPGPAAVLNPAEVITRQNQQEAMRLLDPQSHITGVHTNTPIWSYTRLETIQAQFGHFMTYGESIVESSVFEVVRAVGEKAIKAIGLFACDESGLRVMEVELSVDWKQSAMLAHSTSAITSGLSGWDGTQSPEVKIAGRRFEQAAKRLGLNISYWFLQPGMFSPGRAPRWKQSPVERPEALLDLPELLVTIRRAGES
jgi:hypothetical protein